MTGAVRIAVVDYGVGNLRSAEKALQHVGADAKLTTQAVDIAAADGIVVPGVGAFGHCLTALRDAGLDDVVLDSAHAATEARGVPFLGICVGMQMLFEGSVEDRDVPGLGVLPGEVIELDRSVKRPQMQWNQLHITDPDHWIWAGLEPEPWLYFVHSYAAPIGPDTSSTCQYGSSVVASVTRGNLLATQFHPEKSGGNGLRFLSNFTDACRR